MRDDETNGLELNQLDEEQAPAWNGELDKQVLVEYPSEAAALFAALSNRARQLGHSLQDMCKVLDFSYPYFSQLRSGRRQLNMTSPFTQACASYLGVPRLTVLSLAKVITIEDLQEKPQEMVSSLPKAFDYVAQDPTWMSLMTEEVRIAHLDVRYLSVRLYEQLNQVQLLPEDIELEKLAEGMQKLNQLMEAATDSKKSLKVVD